MLDLLPLIDSMQKHGISLDLDAELADPNVEKLGIGESTTIYVSDEDEEANELKITFLGDFQGVPMLKVHQHKQEAIVQASGYVLLAIAYI